MHFYLLNQVEFEQHIWLISGYNVNFEHEEKK